jgi:hypothetical protein
MYHLTAITLKTAKTFSAGSIRALKWKSAAILMEIIQKFAALMDFKRKIARIVHKALFLTSILIIANQCEIIYEVKFLIFTY